MKRTEKKLNKRHLARVLDVSRGTLDKYLAMEGAPKPDAKGCYIPSAVGAFIEMTAPRAGGLTNEMRVLKERSLRAATLKAEREEQLAAGAVISVEKIKPVIDKFLSELTTNLQQKFEMELPQKCKGKGQIEIQMLNAEAVDFVLKRLKSGVWALGIEAA